MSSVPVDALRFGALSMSEEPVSYDKTRISGSTKVSYILHSKGGCMPGQPELFTTNSRSSPNNGDNIYANKITNAFKHERNIESKSPIGVKYPQNNLSNYTYEEYVPNDDEALNLAIKASYRQVFGNFAPMESERPIDAERRLRNGDISIREFIRLIAKSTFYKTHYFENVNQQRSIELSFKHLLGRPPKNQKEVIKSIELVSSEGFEYHIDSLIDSAEYQEVFGQFIVPYQRFWNSPCGSRTSSFINTAKLTKSFATSDNAIHERKTLSDAKGGVSQLVTSLARETPYSISIPEHAKYLLKEQEKEKTRQKEIQEIEYNLD
tara:strand:+ start:177 stop:1142 length:966 start_codon:yes stop_codon:yes gene_type:complete